MSDKNVLIKTLLDKPIAYHADIARAVGSVTAGLFLCQAIYWSGKGNDPDGWFHKIRENWEQETGMSRKEQETARRILRKNGVLEEQLKGIPARNYYRVNFYGLVNLLKKFYGIPLDKTPNPESSEKSPVGIKCTNKVEEFIKSINPGKSTVGPEGANKEVSKEPTSRPESRFHTIAENTTENTYRDRKTDRYTGVFSKKLIDNTKIENTVLVESDIKKSVSDQLCKETGATTGQLREAIRRTNQYRDHGNIKHSYFGLLKAVIKTVMQEESMVSQMMADTGMLIENSDIMGTGKGVEYSHKGRKGNILTKQPSHKLDERKRAMVRSLYFRDRSVDIEAQKGAV